MFLIEVGGLAVLSVVPVVAALAGYHVLRRPSLFRLSGLVALYSYLLAVAHFTILPLVGPALAAEYRAGAALVQNANLVPLRGLSGPHVLRNVALTIPLGFLVAALAGPRRDLRWMLGVAAASGIAIELIQFGLSALGAVRFRTLDSNDAIANAIGGLVGVAAWCLGGAHLRGAHARRMERQRWS